MERHSSNTSNAMLATVVRQFVPSRIERQLLAQVFEFVVAVQRNSQPMAFDSLDDQHLNEAACLSHVSLSGVVARSAA